MSVVQVSDLKDNLNLTTTLDDVLVQAKIDAAENWIGKFIGTPLPALPPVSPAAPIEPALLEAIKLLAGHLYENRGASLAGISAQDLPNGLLDLLTPYRAWSF